MNANTRICSEHFEGKAKKGKSDVPSIFAWTKKAKGRTTRKPQSNVDEQQSVSESKARTECLTEPSNSTSNTDEMLSCNSASMQGNNENLFLLADVAFPEFKSKYPSSSKDCSSLEMLADVCDQIVQSCDKGCQVNLSKEQMKEKEKDDTIENLESSIKRLTERQLSAKNVKQSDSKLKFEIVTDQCKISYLQRIKNFV